MKCRQCGFDVPEGMKFCGKCATPVANICAACDFENPPDFAFCGACGKPLGDAPPVAPPPTPEPEPVVARPQADAERRDVTVMFCDIVGSTRLSEQLDPEDLREVITRYQRICADSAEVYQGHIAQYLGDGVLIYFGYPQAHENDAVHAIMTGLAIIDGVKAYGESVKAALDISLAVRIGIHTGMVVTGQMGSGETTENLAVGEVPNIAADLQSAASSNMLVVSSQTVDLVRGYFDMESLGSHRIKGSETDLEVFRVLGESGAQDRLGAASRFEPLTPLVGRDSELALLQDRWQKAVRGQGQVVTIGGEAGIGKSRLVETFRELLEGEEMRAQEFRCSTIRQNTALYPFIEYLGRQVGLVEVVDAAHINERHRCIGLLLVYELLL